VKGELQEEKEKKQALILHHWKIPRGRHGVEEIARKPDSKRGEKGLGGKKASPSLLEQSLQRKKWKEKKTTTVKLSSEEKYLYKKERKGLLPHGRKFWDRGNESTMDDLQEKKKPPGRGGKIRAERGGHTPPPTGGGQNYRKNQGKKRGAVSVREKTYY